MKASRIALGFLLLGLTQCSGDRGLLVGGERERGGSSGEAGEENGSGGSGGSSVTGGSGGAQNRGGSESSGGNESSGGSPARGGTGSGAEGGEGAEPGTGGSGARGGTDAGGTNAGGSGADAGSGGDAGSGVRGGSGGSDQGGSGGMARGGTAGTTGDDCDALAREYLQLLAAAQQCSPILTVEQCTSQMPDSIVCGCPTFVNPMRTEEIRRMNEIIEKSRACTWVCPAVVCPAISRGTCSADAIVGTDRGRCTVVR